MAYAIGDMSGGGVFTEDVMMGPELGGADIGPQDSCGDILSRRLYYPVKLELPALAVALSVLFVWPGETLEKPTSDIVPSPVSYRGSPPSSGIPACGPTAATQHNLASTACPCAAQACFRSSGSGPRCAGRRHGC